MIHSHANRYLKTIALYKIFKGACLLVIAFSILVLESRTIWLNELTAWLNEELMLPHGKIVHFILLKVEQFLADDGNLRATGVLAFVYGVVLWVVGLGVYFGKRWAEVLMVVASAALIPLEIYHFTHRPTIIKFCVIVFNMLLVWYLARTLRKHEPATT